MLHSLGPLLLPATLQSLLLNQLKELLKTHLQVAFLPACLPVELALIFLAGDASAVELSSQP